MGDGVAVEHQPEIVHDGLPVWAFAGAVLVAATDHEVLWLAHHIRGWRPGDVSAATDRRRLPEQVPGRASSSRVRAGSGCPSDRRGPQRPQFESVFIQSSSWSWVGWRVLYGHGGPSLRHGSRGADPASWEPRLHCWRRNRAVHQGAGQTCRNGYWTGYTGVAMTDQIAQDDPIVARALLAVGRTRALGLHFYGHFVGIGGGNAADGVSRLTVDAEPEGYGAPGVSVVALATVADLAIGGAIRSHLERGSRLATATLTVQHPKGAIDGPVTARGEAEDRPVEQRAGRCLLEGTAGQPIGNAQGWFAALPPPTGWVQRPMPWEYDEPPPITVPSLGELTADEANAVAAAQAAADRARTRGTSVSEELLHFRWLPAG